MTTLYLESNLFLWFDKDEPGSSIYILLEFKLSPLQFLQSKKYSFLSAVSIPFLAGYALWVHTGYVQIYDLQWHVNYHYHGYPS